MKLRIDNLDGLGPRDYTGSIDGSRFPHVVRKLNKPSELRFSLVADSSGFVVPATGARVTLGLTNGHDVFAGYLMQAPIFEYLGWGERGPIYRYDFVAQSDEALLDEKRLPDRSPFADRSAGDALRQLTQDLMPGVFDTSAVQDLDTLAWYPTDPQKTWSQHAAEIATQARGSYRIMDGALIFEPLGAKIYSLNEADSSFCPAGLKLQSVDELANDVTVVGQSEPQDYIKDYFLGDGLTLKFYLSQTPFTRSAKTLFDEEYTTSTLDPTRWNLSDPAHAVSISSGKLQVSGGTGNDGITTLRFSDKIELGGALIMQHGDVMFDAASSGVVGGLYSGAISVAGCLAGFHITPNGTQSNIQALVNGASTGAAIPTVAGHHYLLTTRLYSQEIYRKMQTFHSSLHPANSGIGGGEIAANVRIVLESHEIDPANPATQIAPSTVLYDGVINSAPDFCTYALLNAANVHCTVAFTRLLQAADTEVRSALPGESYITQLVGSQKEGAECAVTSSSALEFYPQYAPAANQAITVHYRSRGPALARVTSPASIAAQRRGIDDGCHGTVRHLKQPVARTSVDCEFAALAMLDDTTTAAWLGEYQVWSDFLPGNASDIFPGDALVLNVPTRGAAFPVIVNEVEITANDLRGEHFNYAIKFANDAAKAFGFDFATTRATTSFVVNQQTDVQVGGIYLADLTAAEITDASSTTVTIDAGLTPTGGGGIEVRWSDANWGPGNDRNLVGRFNSQSFTVARLSKVQNYYLRQYDASGRYSRYTSALHLDRPL